MGKYDALTPIVEDSEPRQALRQRPGPKDKRTGKSANREEYRQISVYIKKSTHHDAQRAIIGTDEDFSDLVNRLVEEWVESR